ncbi:MAG: hypothetical protein VCA38_11435, partial [Roseibacillus sp.]
NGLDVLVGDAALDFELTNEEKDTLGEEDHEPKQRAKLPKIKKKDKEESSKDKDEKKPASKRPTTAPPPLGTLQGPPLVSSKQNNSAANFAITIGLLFLAILAFCFGLASGHRSKYPKNKYPDSKGLWSDKASIKRGDNPLLEKKKTD